MCYFLFSVVNTSAIICLESLVSETIGNLTKNLLTIDYWPVSSLQLVGYSSVHLTARKSAGKGAP